MYISKFLNLFLLYIFFLIDEGKNEMEEQVGFLLYRIKYEMLMVLLHLVYILVGVVLYLPVILCHCRRLIQINLGDMQNVVSLHKA